MRSIGSGDVSLARSSVRGVDASEVERALEMAIEAGIAVIDVARDAEQLVGGVVRALRARERVTVACRVEPLREIPPPRYVQLQIETSLRATRLEAVPLALLPVRAAWRDKTAWPELAGTCMRLVREGNVLAWGAQLDAIEDDSAQLVDEDWLAAFAVPYSLCEQAAAPVVTAAQAKQRQVLARRPLAGGALAGGLGPGVKLRPHDDRHGVDLEKMAAGVAKLAAFVKHEPAAARSCDAARAQVERNVRPPHLECSTVGELALRALLDRGVIPLPRLHRAEHVAEAIAAAAAASLSTSEQIFSTLVES